MSSIKLYTPSGWELDVDRDNPIFSDLINPVIELEDDTHKISLKGSVGAALEREYDTVVVLFDLIQEGDKSIKSAVEKAKLLQIKISQIRVITTILNMPDGWSAFVGVDPGDPDYYQHHVRISQSPYTKKYVTDNGRLSMDIMTLAMQHPGRVTSVARLMNNVPILTKDSRSERGKIELAMLYNLHLTDYVLNGTLYEFDWLGLIELLRRAGVELPSDEEQTYLTYAGIGDYSSEAMGVLAMVTKKNEKQKGIAKLTIKYDTPVSRYYVQSLACYPEDVDPRSLGLTYLLLPKKINKTYVENAQNVSELAENKFANIANWVHENISLIAYHNAKASGSDRVEEMQVELFIAYAIEYMMGTRGLTHVLLSVLHEMDRSSNTSSQQYKRLEYIANKIEEKLESSEVRSDLLNKFPNYIL